MIALINTRITGSTGRIIMGLQEHLLSQGHDAVVCYGKGKRSKNKNTYKFCTDIEIYVHYLMQRISGQLCIGSRWATKRLVKWMRKNNVKEVYLENLHGFYLNEKILFDYLVSEKVKVVYIMADESAIWGSCFYNPGCDLYKQSCVGCPKLHRWQLRLFNEPARRAFQIKQEAYPLLNAVFAAPEYVINTARNSILLKGRKTVIVDEAIDVTVNHPYDTKELRKDLVIDDNKIIIVCVAPNDSRHTNKGVTYFIEAAKSLENDERFVFVHVGWQLKDKSGLPKNYIAIGFVRSQEVLAHYYSMGDLFVFPSLFDSMPNACLEALACGTPLLCFNTSGMPYIGDKTVLTLVEPKNVEQLVSIISTTTKKTQEKIDTCRNYALKRYDSRKYFAILASLMNEL